MVAFLQEATGRRLECWFSVLLAVGISILGGAGCDSRASKEAMSSPRTPNYEVTSSLDHTRVLVRGEGGEELRLWSLQSETEPLFEVAFLPFETDDRGLVTNRLAQPLVAIVGSVGEYGFESGFSNALEALLTANSSSGEPKILVATNQSGGLIVGLDESNFGLSMQLEGSVEGSKDNEKHAQNAPTFDFFENPRFTNRQGQLTYSIDMGIRFGELRTRSEEKVVLNVASTAPLTFSVEPKQLVFFASDAHVRQRVVVTRENEDRTVFSDSPLLLFEIDPDASAFQFGFFPEIAFQIPVEGTHRSVAPDEDENVLRILTFSEYFDTVIGEFESEFKVRAELEYVSSTEDYVARLMDTNKPPVDVVVPSHFSVLDLAEPGTYDGQPRDALLEPLSDRVRRRSADRLDPLFIHYFRERLGVNESATILQYSIPYLVSTVGGCYHAQNFQYVPLRWKDFFVDAYQANTRAKLLLVDEPRVVLGSGLLTLESSPSSRLTLAMSEFKRVIIHSENPNAGEADAFPEVDKKRIFDMCRALLSIATALQDNGATITSGDNPLDDETRAAFDYSHVEGVGLVARWEDVMVKAGIHSEKEEPEAYAELSVDGVHGLMGEIALWRELLDGPLAELEITPEMGFINTTNRHKIQESALVISNIVTQNAVSINHDRISELMVRNEADLALAWSGDATDAMLQNRNIRFVSPSPGGIMVFDCIAIVKGTTKRTLASQFVEYLLNEKVAAEVTRYSRFANTVARSRLHIPSTILNGPSYYFPNVEDAYMLGRIDHATMDLYTELWEGVRKAAIKRGQSHQFQIVFGAASNNPQGN